MSATLSVSLTPPLLPSMSSANLVYADRGHRLNDGSRDGAANRAAGRGGLPRRREGSELHAFFVEVFSRDARRLERRRRHVPAAVEFDHDHAVEGPGLHHVENGGNIDLALPERTVAHILLAAGEVLEVHVLDERQEILDHLHGVGPTFLKLSNVGAELQVTRVGGLHDRVGFVTRLDAG